MKGAAPVALGAMMPTNKSPSMSSIVQIHGVLTARAGDREWERAGPLHCLVISIGLLVCQFAMEGLLEES